VSNLEKGTLLRELTTGGGLFVCFCGSCLACMDLLLKLMQATPSLLDCSKLLKAEVTQEPISQLAVLMSVEDENLIQCR
jgi:hypothetical protein